MSNDQFKNFLKNQVLLELKARKVKRSMTEEQIGHVAHALILESETLNEGLLDTIASLLGGGLTSVKKFLARRAVSYLGVGKKSPLYAPLTDFISSMPSQDIMSLYRDDIRNRDKLINVIANESINVLERDMASFLGVDANSSLGGSIVDSITTVVRSPGFKSSIKDSFNNSFVKFVNSDVSNMDDIRRAVSDLRGDIGDLTGDISNLKNRMTSDPTKKDTDSDGLPDGAEKQIGTDPKQKDTDGDGLPDGEEVGSIKDKIKDKPKVEKGEAVEKAKEAEEKASDAAEAAAEAEDKGEEQEATNAAEEAQEAAEEAQEAADAAVEEPEADEAEKAAEQARIKAQKAEASKLRIPMRDFIKAKLNLDNDLGRYDPRISLEDLQVIHDNFVAAETDQQRLAAIETFARAKTFEELTKLIGAPDTEAPTPEPGADIEEPAEEVPEPEVAEEPAEETPEPEAETGEESIPSDVLEKYRRLYDLYNEPGNTFNKALKLSKQIEDLETKYPELVDFDLGSEDEDEPEVEDLPEPEVEKEPVRMTRPTETPGVGKDVEVGEYELSLDPKSEKSKKALLDTIEELQPEGNMELYQANLNKYLDRQVDRFYEEAQEKAPKAKSVKDKKKTEKQYTEEYVAKQTAKMLDVIEDKVSEKGSTEGFSYIFGRAVPTASSPETVEKKISYRQVDVVLDDDKTTVMSSRPPEKTKISRPKLGESILEEERKEIFSVDLPPISVEDIPKLTWTQSKEQERAALARKVLELLKAKQEEDPESVEMFDLGQDEETGTPNLVIMKTSLNLDNTVAAGVIDQRKRGVIEIPEGSMKNTYSTLVTKYITKIEDKKAGIVPGMFNSNKAVVDYPPEVANRLKGKRLKELADHLGLDTSDFEFSMPFIIQYILEKTGDLVTSAPQVRDEPTSKAPEMSPEEEDAMEPSEADLAALERGDEEEELDENINISYEMLEKLLS